MNSKQICRKLLTLLLSLSLIFSSVVCASCSENPQSGEKASQNTSNLAVENININDSFVRLEIIGIDNTPINTYESLNFTPDFSRDLIQNSLSKAEIISKYGDDIYSQLISNYNFIINCLGTQAKGIRVLRSTAAEEGARGKRMGNVYSG